MQDTTSLPPQYAAIQQQIIDVRDRLDAEVTRLRRMHTFTRLALRATGEDEFSDLAGEAIVDIFEFEFGICWPLSETLTPTDAIGVLGLHVAHEELLTLGQSLSRFVEQSASQRRLSAEALGRLHPTLAIQSGLVSSCHDGSGKAVAIIFGGNTPEGSRFSEPVSPQVEESFRLFAAQVGGLIEQQRNRLEIHHLNRDLNAILTATPDLLFELDADGTYVNIWAREAELLAAPREELVGSTIHDVLPQHAAATCQSALNEAEEHGTSVGQEIHLSTPSGERWFELSVAQKAGPDSPPRFMVLSRDVTDRKAAADRVKQSEARLRHLFEQTDAIAVHGYNEDGEVVYWNQTSRDLYGYTLSELRSDGRQGNTPSGQPLFVPPEIQPWTETGIPPDPGERSRLHKSGETVQVLANYVAVPSGDGGQELLCIDTDLSGLKRAEKQLLLLSQAVSQSPVGVIITDTAGNIEYMNPAYESISGYSAAEIIGQHTPRVFSSGTTEESVYEELWSTITRKKEWKGEILNRKRNGETFWEELYVSPVLDDDGEIINFIAVKEDISLRKAQEAEILQQAYFDTLTGLPNRRLSLDRLQNMLKTAARNQSMVAVLFMDVDNFKRINDSLGHDTGDAVLVEVARRLAAAVRDQDTVGRLAGDEFVILIDDLHKPTDAARIAKAVLAHFRETIHANGRDLAVTLSIGIAIYPRDATSKADLLARADTAMYHSKTEGRNTFSFFTDTLMQGVAEQMAIEERMLGALQRGDMYVSYQPIICLASRQIACVEALVRWQDPELGQIPPNDFITIAEQNREIVPIGRFVMTQAIQQVAAWQKKTGIPLNLAINLSPRQFRDPELVDTVTQLIAIHGINPDQLEFEITEGVLMTGSEVTEAALKSLKELGASLVMDDFGTGYSSLSYLRRYPFDKLKVDRSFVRDMASDRRDFELVNAAVAMGHGLAMRVVAEGVETREQLTLLQEMGCDMIQGAFCTMPVSAVELEKMLNNGNCTLQTAD